MYFLLFAEFFKVGLFAIGGGLATLPFLYDLAAKYTWFDESMLADMIAVSESTPGPIGINMATYAGFHSGGILGGIISTVGLVAPSVIIIIVVAHFLKKFRSSKYVEAIFYTLRPAVTGLIAIAGYQVIKISVLTIANFKASGNLVNLINWKAAAIFLAFFCISNKIKTHPIVYIALGAVIGIVMKL